MKNKLDELLEYAIKHAPILRNHTQFGTLAQEITDMVDDEVKEKASYKADLEFLYNEIMNEQTDGDDVAWDEIISRMEKHGYKISREDLVLREGD